MIYDITIYIYEMYGITYGEIIVYRKLVIYEALINTMKCRRHKKIQENKI